jgi:hypothetical protein
MNPDGSRFSMVWGRFWFVAPWFVYCSVAFFLYRRAALTHRGFSEIVGFIVLPSLAWLGYFIALAGSPYLRPRSTYRYLGLVVLAIAGVFFSTWLWLVIAVNLYGK